jgi:hypothetical protein
LYIWDVIAKWFLGHQSKVCFDVFLYLFFRVLTNEHSKFCRNFWKKS